MNVLTNPFKENRHTIHTFYLLSQSIAAVLALVVVILMIRRVRKRRTIDEFHECYQPALPKGSSQPAMGNGDAVHGYSDDDVTGKTLSISTTGPTERRGSSPPHYFFLEKVCLREIERKKEIKTLYL